METTLPTNPDLPPPSDQGMIFQKSSQGLSAEIRTEHLFLRSVVAGDLSLYMQTYGNPEAMKHFAKGETKDEQYVAHRINLWANRWRSDNPFSAFTILHKDTQEFLGHIVVGHGDRPGQSEMAFLFRPEYKKAGYEEEAVAAMLKVYVPEIVKQGYLINGKPLDEIHATVKPDLEEENALLAKHMTLRQRIQKFGEDRNEYVITIQDATKEESFFERCKQALGSVCFF